MPLPAAALFFLVAAGESLRWSADVDTQARGRSEPTGGQTSQVGEISMSGRLGLDLRLPDESASLTWSPRGLLREAISGQPTGTGNSTQQGGRFDMVARLTPTTRLGLRSGADWGLTDFSPLASPATIPGSGLLPTQRFVRTLSLDAAVELRHRFSRQLELAASGGVQRTGGAGHEAVEVLPVQVGALSTASLAWTTERDTVVALQTSASHTRFSLGRTSQLSETQISWASRPFRPVGCDLAAGVALIRSEAADATTLNVYASGLAGLRWDIPLSPTRGLSTAVRGRLAPAIDRLTGLAVENVRGESSADLVDGRIRFGLAASGGRAISGISTGTEDLRFDAHSSWTLQRGVAVEAAFTTAWTNQQPLAGWQQQVYVGFHWSGAGAL